MIIEVLRNFLDTRMICLCAALLLAGCRSTEPVAVNENSDLEAGLQGRWYFVYCEAADTESPVMPGPPFDSLRFLPERKAEVSMGGGAGIMAASYSLRGADLRLRLPIGGSRRGMSVRCQAYLADEGRVLVLRDAGTGAVFLGERYLEPAYQVADTWYQGSGAERQTVQLALDGTAVFSRGGRGWYRLWRSEKGLMMSLFLRMPRGVRTIVWQAELSPDGGTLKLLPYGKKGIQQGKALTLMRPTK